MLQAMISFLAACDATGRIGHVVYHGGTSKLGKKGNAAWDSRRKQWDIRARFSTACQFKAYEREDGAQPEPVSWLRKLSAFIGEYTGSDPSKEGYYLTIRPLRTKIVCWEKKIASGDWVVMSQADIDHVVTPFLPPPKEREGMKWMNVHANNIIRMVADRKVFQA